MNLTDILRNTAVIAIIAYLFSKTAVFRRTLVNSHSRRDIILLSSFFGFLSILGSYLGIPVEGALANSRIVGPVLGGLIGGPVVGVIAGIMGAIYRYYLGGYTVPASVISNITAGFIGGFFYRKHGLQNITLRDGFLACFLSELVLKALILILSKPFEAAWKLEKIIAVPTIFSNCLGTVIFLLMVKDIYAQNESSASLAAEKSLTIAKETLYILRKGLNFETAEATAGIIKEIAEVPAVAIINHEKVLAFVGVGNNHHKKGDPITALPTKEVFETKNIAVSENKKSIGCTSNRCPLTTLIAAPLVVNNRVLAAIELYKISGDPISPTEMKIVEGTASLLSIQLELAESEKKAQLLTKAEYNALKAQINPHFLFNALSTIMFLCRTDIDLARKTLKQLGDFFRSTLENKKDKISLNEELKNVHSYVAIEKLRFADRLEIIEEIDPASLDQLIPVFTLQPLVENALKHGLFPKQTPGTLFIETKIVDKHVVIKIEDDGTGIDPDTLAKINSETATSKFGIGLSNVNKRLKNFYGPEYGLKIFSKKNQGTRLEIMIPYYTEQQEEE